MMTLQASAAVRSGRLQVFHHHIYEYKKGLRSLILYTGRSEDRSRIEERLAREGIACLIREVTPDKINVFFGAAACVQVIKSFGSKSLAEFTSEEDFMLGIMLGYDKLQQCERYLHYRPRRQNFFCTNIRNT
jgi:hypothetical protein